MVLDGICFAFSVHLTAPDHLDQIPLADLPSQWQNQEVCGTVWSWCDIEEGFEEERAIFHDSHEGGEGE